jgi:hypothetical protein
MMCYCCRVLLTQYCSKQTTHLVLVVLTEPQSSCPGVAAENMSVLALVLPVS